MALHHDKCTASSLTFKETQSLIADNSDGPGSGIKGWIQDLVKARAKPRCLFSIPRAWGPTAEQTPPLPLAASLQGAERTAGLPNPHPAPQQCCGCLQPLQPPIPAEKLVFFGGVQEGGSSRRSSAFGVGWTGCGCSAPPATPAQA